LTLWFGWLVDGFWIVEKMELTWVQLDLLLPAKILIPSPVKMIGGRTRTALLAMSD